MKRAFVSAATVAALMMGSGCAGVMGVAAPHEDAPLVQGPPVRDVVTPFDEALRCLRGRINNDITFAVGAVLDQTGREQLTEGGAGKFVTQGAGDIIQSALFTAGTAVVNRRDPRVIVTEMQWNLRDAQPLVPAAFHITGSINSLDFIPGHGFDATVSGVGPRYRQHRILVGLDLAMTDSTTSRLVANVALQKQVIAEEYGVGVGRFFGDTLVSLDAGGQNREALHFALREMLNLATFELLTQMMRPDTWVDCHDHIDEAHGFVGNTGTAERAAEAQEAMTGDESGAAGRSPASEREESAYEGGADGAEAPMSDAAPATATAGETPTAETDADADEEAAPFDPEPSSPVAARGRDVRLFQ